jgi:hypothetical protein
VIELGAAEVVPGPVREHLDAALAAAPDNDLVDAAARHRALVAGPEATVAEELNPHDQPGKLYPPVRNGATNALRHLGSGGSQPDSPGRSGRNLGRRMGYMSCT